MGRLIQAYDRFSGVGGAGNLVVSAIPTPGVFYRTKKGDTPWSIANNVYAKTGLTSIKTGLMLLNNNIGNYHIKKAKAGWTSYGIKGLQFTPDYASGSYTATHGTGTAYPLLWIPPITGAAPPTETPSIVQGERGSRGATGKQGLPGVTPGEKQIASILNDYLTKNPPARGERGERGVDGKPASKTSKKEIIAILNDYLTKNPPAKGTKGDQGLPGLPGIPGKTGKTINKEEIAKLVNDFLKKNPPARGTKGDRGAAGPGGATGSPGSTPGRQQIVSIVNDFLTKNPPAKGSKGDRGATGAAGAKGDRGATGAAGANIQTVKKTPTSNTSSMFSGFKDIKLQIIILALLGGATGAWITKGKK